MKDNINICIKNFRLNHWIENIVKQIEKIQKIKENQWSIVIIGDKAMRGLNKNHRKIDKITDVLSFAECDVNSKYREKGYLGEIIINYQQAKRQSKNIKDEIINLLIHGYLHLNSYTHDNDKNELIMNKEAERIIKKIKL